MGFTDDDLKRLKQSLEGEAAPKVLRRDEQKALIHRLETAENLIGIDEGTNTFSQRYKAWRKAAGK